DRALALIPDDAGALALQAAAKDALVKQRQAAIVRAGIGNARRRFLNGKHQAALDLLESLDPASHSAVADTLKELRDELLRIEERRRAERELADGLVELTRPSSDGQAAAAAAAVEADATRLMNGQRAAQELTVVVAPPEQPHDLNEV